MTAAAKNAILSLRSLGSPSAFVRSLRAALATSDDLAPFALRVVFAGVMFPHGAQHALGWFGGYGFDGTYDWMTGTLGIPGVFAAIAIVTELVAPLFLLLGLGTRFAAMGLGILLAVAASTHLGAGFFMNWTGAKPGEGFEYHLLGVALAFAVAVYGGGKWSADRGIATTRQS